MEKEVARESDLQAHIRAPWQTAHGIWAAISDPTVTAIISKAKFRAYVSSAQNDLAAGWQKVICNGVTRNPGGYYDAVTNYRFTAPAAGDYLFMGATFLTGAVDNMGYYLGFYVDGSLYSQSRKISSYNFAAVGLSHMDQIYLTAGQYVELWINNAGGNTAVDITTGSATSFFAGHIISV